MADSQKRLDIRRPLLCLLALWAGPIAPAWGQQEPPADSASPPGASQSTAAPATEPVAAQAQPQSATVKLLRRLVERGVIDAAEADALAAQAEAEVRAAAQGLPPPEGTKRVTYVPEVVKAELRNEIRAELLEEVKRNNWAAPNALPEWTKRITLSGDARLRYEIDNFGAGNAVDYYPDFNGINTGKPFDVNFRDPASERWLNTNRRRSRARLRARLDVEANLGQGFSTEARVVTGDGPTPVSTNQTIGGSGGNFSKYQVWLDRANVRYRPFNGEGGRLALLLGRFENPFFKTDLTWDDNLNFDGAAVQGELQLGSGFRPFLTGGAFPIFNTAFDLAPERPDKFKSRDKWLYAAQAGTEWRPTPRIGVKFGIGFYFFDRVRGILGSECDTNVSSVSCDTDHSRPSFAQKGNTYRPLRTPSIAALDAELTGAASRYQFFGLASPFRDLVYTGRVEVLALPQLKVGIEGELVRNLAFRRRRIAPDAVNNFKACSASDSACRDDPPYGGGNMGYLARLTVGSPGMSHRWDWNVALSYRYLQSDAVVDAFPNAEFALGGTNNKGFVAAATLALADNVAAAVRWLSSDVIVGPQYSIDVVHFDLSVRY